MDRDHLGLGENKCGATVNWMSVDRFAHARTHLGGAVLEA